MQPVRRDNSDFDAGLKKQVPTGTGYIRYYVSAILQFQFLRAMCPLGQLDCDLQADENVHSRLYPMMTRGATEVRKVTPKIVLCLKYGYFRNIYCKCALSILKLDYTNVQNRVISQVNTR